MADTTVDETPAADLVGQQLQKCDEVYLYKIPPLKTAGGHRYVLVNTILTSATYLFFLDAIAKLALSFHRFG